MAKNKENDFNRLQHLLDQQSDPKPKDIALTQLASDFHKDLRQAELIDHLAQFAASVDSLRGAIDKLNTDTAAVYNHLYGKLNCFTLVIAVATVINSVALVVQVVLQVLGRN
jgi:hypothetical protein